MKKHLVHLQQFMDMYKEVNIGIYASSAAFYIFLSLIPIIVLIFTIIPYTPLTQEGVLLVLAEVLPSSIDQFTVNVVNEMYAKYPGLLSVSAIITLWSAGKGMQAITRGLNAVNGVKETRNFIVLRLEACLYTVILLILVIISVGVFIFGSVIIKSFLTRFIADTSFIHTLFPYRFLVEWIIFALLFSFMYAWVPNKRCRPRKQLTGAVLAGVSWTLFSWGFSVYLEYFPAFSMYGSLATIIILMIWIYVCMILIFIGALVNVFLKKKKEEAALINEKEEKKEKFHKRAKKV